jgi:hypothetical protein
VGSAKSPANVSSLGFLFLGCFVRARGAQTKSC